MVFVKSIQGNTLIFDVGAGSSVEALKLLISAEEGLNVEDQRLLYAGKYVSFADSRENWL